MTKNQQPVNPFQKAPVQLCRLETKLPKNGGWIYELKFDGYRVSAYIEGGQARLSSRNGNDFTDRFKPLSDALAAQAKGGAFVLDGEVVVLDKNGKSDFSALQNYHKARKDGSLAYIAFDMLAAGGSDLRDEPLLSRKEKLREFLKNAPKNLHFSEHTNEFSAENFGKICDGNFEGIVVKKADSPYSGTRNGDWIKLKCPCFLREISSPEKQMFKGISKLEVAEYYEKISGRMLPYIEKRLLALVRCPKGAGAPCFYKKHPTAEGRGIEKVGEYFYITGLTGLLNEVQMNTLEFHVWGSRADNVDHPDIMVFDLDPDEGMSLANVREGVEDLKSVLDGLGLTAFLKTSGGKGYHVVVPFAPSADWESFKGFSKKIAEFMEQKWSEKYTANVRKQSRKGKIYIDYLRNGKGATSVAPYSVRARENARVSLPIAWEELHTVAPDGITMSEAAERLTAPDPWKNFWKTREKQRLK